MRLRLSAAITALSLLFTGLGCAEDPLLAAIAKAPLVDEVRIAEADPGHRFLQQPADASATATLAGVKVRGLANAGAAKLFAVRLGEGKGLAADATYILEVDVVEDQPRTFFILNRGDDTLRGISCGPSLPDCLGQYTQQNPEVLALPLAKGVRTWRSVFRLLDRFGDIKRERSATNMPFTPVDGFWVIICQPEAKHLPGSAGAAVGAIRLRRIADPAPLALAINRPPKELPWRHSFWREEMADSVIGAEKPEARGVADRLRWYAHKLQTMRILGYDTLCKDLLEFGHNQGWDSAPYGGNDWVNQTKYPGLWAGIVALAGKAGVPVLPYYEYAGSVGGKSLGRERRCRPLGDSPTYTHIEWTEKANADVTDPAFREDFAKVLDCTVLRLKDSATFLGAWIRPRPSAMPIGFSDAALARFAAAAKETGVTRGRLIADEALRKRYYAWWFGCRRDFLTAARDTLRKGGVKDASILFSAYTGEPTPSFNRDALVVEGDPTPWKALLGDDKRPVMSLAEAIAGPRYLDTILAFPGTWAKWEWNHACPPADPAAYTAVDGVAVTYPYNRVYSTSVDAGMDAFRCPAGLAMVHHLPLNERSVPEELIGYACADAELAGPASVLPEVLAVAHGDPRWLASLNGTAMTTGYPEFRRAFQAAFLALPALPSTVDAKACPAKGVIVRRIDGGAHGIWLAVANTTYAAVATTLTLPKAGTVIDAGTGEALKPVGATLKIDLAPCSLRAMRIR